MSSLLLEVVEDTVLEDEPALPLALHLPSLLGQPALSLGVEEGLCQLIAVWYLKCLFLDALVQTLSIVRDAGVSAKGVCLCVCTTCVCVQCTWCVLCCSM